MSLSFGVRIPITVRIWFFQGTTPGELVSGVARLLMAAQLT